MSRFINPYNFIPLMPAESRMSEKERSPQGVCRTKEGSDRHTGVIEYTLTTKTPLFIPNSSNDHAFELKNMKEGVHEEDHKSYDFFSYTQLEKGKRYNDEYHEPVIPGSELRGCIRNLYETLTGSCMAVLNEDIVPVKRTSEIFKPALIHRKGDGKYSLIKAVACRTKVGKAKAKDKKYNEGDLVKFEYMKKNERRQSSPVVNIISEDSDSFRRGSVMTGYVLIGEWMPGQDGTTAKQKHVHVFVPKNENEIAKNFFSDDDFEKLKNVIEHYQAQAQAGSKPYEDYRKRLEEFKKGGGEGYFPVYYSQVPDASNKKKPDVSDKEKPPVYYFSPAQRTKELAHTTIGAAAGEFKPCADAENPCPACALFGMVGKAANDKLNAIASKLRFSDMVRVSEQELYEGCVTLPPLNSPKPSNAEFYLKKPDGADFWTYDYYIKDGKIQLYDPKLRGRKFYWHHKPNIDEWRNMEATKLNMTIRPLRDGITFCGKLFFEGISDMQLKQLVWILNGGNDQGNKLAYKLGAAKPLGFGSVELSVTKVLERRIAKVTGNSGKEMLQYQNVIRYGGAADGADAIDIARLQYNGSDPEDKNDLGFVREIKDAFEKICDFHALDHALENEEHIKVSYPITQNNGQCEEGFKWFTEINHTGRGSKRKEEKLLYSLCGIMDSDLSLPMEPEHATSGRTGFNRVASGRTSFNRVTSGRTDFDRSAPECAAPGCHNTVTQNRDGKWFRYCKKCYTEYQKKNKKRNGSGKK